MTIARTPLHDLQFDAVLFDMDGTLVDSTAAVERSWRTWAGEHDVTVAALAGSHGRPAVEIVADVLAADLVSAALARIIALEIADTDGVVPLPGAVDALSALPPGAAAIVTSCTGDLAAARIAAAHVVGGDEHRRCRQPGRGKPDPEPFLLAARRLGVDPRRCLVVEDAPAGLAAGRAAGATTLAVAGTHRHDQLDADAGVPDLSHVRFTGAAGTVRLA